jgi:hypothetical protein
MKRIAHMALKVFLLAATTALTTWAQKVNVDFDKQANFSGYKTYAWASGTRAKNPLMDQRIIEGIDSRMAAKGLQKVDANANPDLAVLYHAAVGAETQISTMNTGYGGWGYRWGGGMGTSTSTVEQIPIGTLSLDIGDAKTKKLLWLGTATDSLSDNPDKNTKKINNALDKMFKKFPPPPPKN